MAIDLRNYRVTAAARGWGPGWPSCKGVRDAGTAVVRADRSGVGVSVHRRIARLVDLLLDETERRGYLLRAGECGGYNCLAGETLVMTLDGDVPIRDLAGTTARLLSRRGAGRAAGGPGRWVAAPVRSFGIQPLRRIVLTRRGVEREVYATPDHRWLLDEPDRACQERTTDALLPGQRLASIYPRSVATRVGLSSVGAAHGIVYGDGTLTKNEARVVLCGGKNVPLLRYFPEPHVLSHEAGLMVTRLPRSWKLLPSRDEGSSYLYGFLAGYFAADGDVNKRGTPRLCSADRDALQFVRVLCTQLGIATTGIIDTKRVGIAGETSSLYSITLSARSLTDEFFLLPEHRDRFVASPRRYAPARWSVVSVHETDRTEEVFCAVVPDTESFALADNLLTGNCRAIAGTSTPSNHSWALAIDINWNHNPFQRPRRTDMPSWMPLLWNRYGFAWGGNYANNGTTGKADSMHYEFMGTPADADGMTALALRELRGGAPPLIGNPGEDDPVTAIPIAVQANGTFRASAMAEAGASSVVVDRAWLTYGSTWGATHFVVTALDGGGRVMAQETFDMANNTGRAMALPSGCRLVTLEGTAAAGAVPAAALVNKNR